MKKIKKAGKAKKKVTEWIILIKKYLSLYLVQIQQQISVVPLKYMFINDKGILMHQTIELKKLYVYDI